MKAKEENFDESDIGSVVYFYKDKDNILMVGDIVKTSDGNIAMTNIKKVGIKKRYNRK